MTQRERILAIAVGGVLMVLGLQWGFNRFREARSQRDIQIGQLESELQTASNSRVCRLPTRWANSLLVHSHPMGMKR